MVELARARAGASATLPIPSESALFRRAPRRPWPPERPGHPTEATGGLPMARRAFVKLARCPRTGGRGTVELARRPCGGIVRILQRLSEPPGGRRWPPEVGSASLDAIGGGVHDGIGALPDRIGVCPHAIVLARAGHGGGTVELARRPCGGIVRILRWLSETPGGRRSPPEGGPASLEAMGRRAGKPLFCRATPLFENFTSGNADPGGASSEFYDGSQSRRNATGRPPVASGGWPGLSGGHGRQGARRNRGVAQRNRDLPARDCARKGW